MVKIARPRKNYPLAFGLPATVPWTLEVLEHAVFIYEKPARNRTLGNQLRNTFLYQHHVFLETQNLNFGGLEALFWRLWAPFGHLFELWGGTGDPLGHPRRHFGAQGPPGQKKRGKPWFVGRPWVPQGRPIWVTLGLKTQKNVKKKLQESTLKNDPIQKGPKPWNWRLLHTFSCFFWSPGLQKRSQNESQNWVKWHPMP